MRFVGTILFIFLLFPFTPGWAVSERVDQIRALRTAEPSLLNAYLDLMENNKLIHQLSNGLKKRKLLKKDGGLCAFTAQVNSIQGVSKYFKIAQSKFLKRPAYFEYQVIDEARAFMENDPTYAGALLSEVEMYTENVLEQYGLDQIVHLDYTAKKSDLDPDKFKTYYWKLRIVGMTNAAGDEGHTVILLKVDPSKNFMYLSDPNYPNKVVQVKYRKAKKGLEIFLTDDFPGFQPAIIDEMIEVNVLK